MASTQTSTGGVVKVASGAGFSTWQRERPLGTLRLTWSARGAVRMHVAGRGAGDFAPLIIERYQVAVRDTGSVLILFDLAKMQNYDTDLRQRLTDWCLTNRSSIAGMHLHTESNVVLMGARVASLLLRGLMEIHSQRDSFDTVVRGAGLAPPAA